MADVKLDFDDLLSSASSAERIAGDMSAAERFADEIAVYTGHDGLAGRVRDFGGKRDIARGKLEGNLTAIGDSLRAVVDTFEDLDTDLASSLNDSAIGDGTATRELDEAIAEATDGDS